MKNTNFSKKRTNNLVISAILLALGTILHGLIPSVGIKPDFMLASMFIAIYLSDDLSLSIIIGICAGILSALTTNFPGGQIPSLFDKFFSGIIFYMLVQFVKRFNTNKNLIYSALIFICTIISGLIFLYSALILANLMGLQSTIEILSNGIYSMFVAIILPTSIANAIFGMLIIKILSNKLLFKMLDHK